MKRRTKIYYYKIDIEPHLVKRLYSRMMMAWMMQNNMQPVANM